MTELTLDIQRLESDIAAPTDEAFTIWINAALAGAGYDAADAEVSLALVSTDEITELNHQYRHKNDATNVLSFPADLPDGVDVPLLGDIIVCNAVVEREAQEQSKTVQDHWAHMVIHGTLHLLGFDHIIEQEAEEMEALEVAILQGLGIKNPYELPASVDSASISANDIKNA